MLRFRPSRYPGAVHSLGWLADFAGAIACGLSGIERVEVHAVLWFGTLSRRAVGAAVYSGCLAGVNIHLSILYQICHVKGQQGNLQTDIKSAKHGGPTSTGGKAGDTRYHEFPSSTSPSH